LAQASVQAYSFPGKKMAGLTAMLHVFALLPWCGIAATLHSEDRSGIIRSEVSSRRVNLNAHGDIIKASGAAEVIQTLRGATCNIDFLMGQEKKNNCTTLGGGGGGGNSSGGNGTLLELANGTAPESGGGGGGAPVYPQPTAHTLLIDRGQCRDAAAIMNGKVQNATLFAKTYDEQDFVPKGCFQDACDPPGENAWDKVCFFYNANGDWPRSIASGTPICTRPKLLNGTKDTDGASCVDAYKVIDDDAVCKSAALCLGYEIAPKEEYSIGNFNASEHLDRPRGCFINEKNGYVYYNDYDPTIIPQRATVKVTGIPLCIVESVETVGPADPNANSTTGGGSANATK